MSFINTLMKGEQGLFKEESPRAMQKLTLRFVLVGLVNYLYLVVEGMLMRIFEVEQIAMSTGKKLYMQPSTYYFPYSPMGQNSTVRNWPISPSVSS